MMASRVVSMPPVCITGAMMQVLTSSRGAGTSCLWAGHPGARALTITDRY